MGKAVFWKASFWKAASRESCFMEKIYYGNLQSCPSVTSKVDGENECYCPLQSGCEVQHTDDAGIEPTPADNTPAEV